MALENSRHKNQHGFKELPNFNLKNIDGKNWDSKNLIGKKGTLIAFICNHCPYVKAIIDDLVEDAKTLEELGINTIGICSNDHPDDSFEKMIEFAKAHKITFPYLIDETQEIAKQFGAVCTPDFFLFLNENGKQILKHKGRLNNRKAKEQESNFQLQRELLPIVQYLLGEKIDTASSSIIKDYQEGKSLNSIGCSIKWKNE